eukprot:15326254-Ditylum_brightwellii.AAC.1
MAILFGTNTDFKRGILGKEHEEQVQSFPCLSMSIVVIMLYIIKVVPDLIVRFYNSVGTASTVHARLNHISEQLWLKDDDRIGQKIGLKMGEFAKYPCLEQFPSCSGNITFRK